MVFKKLVKHRLFSGFTLIELLVVISIILVITGGGIAGFINFNERQQVQTKVKEIQTLMRSAQIKSRAGEAADECQDIDRLLKGYRVRIDYTDGDRIKLERICMLPDKPLSDFDVHKRGEIEPNNVTFSMVNELGSNANVIFLTLRGGLQVRPAGTILTVTVTSESGNISYEFQVNDRGEITEGAFL